MATNPTLLTMPIAENGTKNTIPTTTTTLGRMSQDQGFPTETSLPLAAGGVAPSRADFNGAFNLLSDINFYAQKGWQFLFDASQDYYAGCIVRDATDGQLYECIADVAAGGSVPSADTTHWRVSEKVFYFDSVADMRDASAVVPGMMVMTKGHYSPNDGGAATYNIRTAESGDVDDGGSIIVLDNGNVAELITNGTVNVKQFGAKGDGTTDDTPAIQAAINFGAVEYNTISVPEGTYIISDKLTHYTTNQDSLLATKNGICIIGTGKSVIKASSTFPADTPMLALDGNPNESTTPAWYQIGNNIQNITFDGNNKADMGLFLRACLCCDFDGMTVRQIAGGSTTGAIHFKTYDVQPDVDCSLSCMFSNCRILDCGCNGIYTEGGRIATILLQKTRISNMQYDGIKAAYASFSIIESSISSCGKSHTGGGFATAPTTSSNRGLEICGSTFEDNWNYELDLNFAQGFVIESTCLTPYERATSGQCVVKIGGTQADNGVIIGCRVADYQAPNGRVITGFKIEDGASNISIENTSFIDTASSWLTNDQKYSISAIASNIRIDGIEKSARNGKCFVHVDGQTTQTLSNVLVGNSSYNLKNLFKKGVCVLTDKNGIFVSNDYVPGYINGTSLTVGETDVNTIRVGDLLLSRGSVLPNTFITGYGSGTGGQGTYTVSRSHTAFATEPLHILHKLSFDDIEGEFTAPESGQYLVEVKMEFTGWGNARGIQLYAVSGTVQYFMGTTLTSSTETYIQACGHAIVNVQKGNKLNLYASLVGAGETASVYVRSPLRTTSLTITKID